MIIPRSIVCLATAAGLVLGSTAAAAAPPAAPRNATPMAKSENLAGVGTFGVILGLLLVTVAIAVVSSGHNHNNPVSP